VNQLRKKLSIAGMFVLYIVSSSACFGGWEIVPEEEWTQDDVIRINTHKYINQVIAGDISAAFHIIETHLNKSDLDKEEYAFIIHWIDWILDQPDSEILEVKEYYADLRSSLINKIDLLVDIDSGELKIKDASSNLVEYRNTYLHILNSELSLKLPSFISKERIAYKSDDGDGLTPDIDKIVSDEEESYPYLKVTDDMRSVLVDDLIRLSLIGNPYAMLFLTATCDSDNFNIGYMCFYTKSRTFLSLKMLKKFANNYDINAITIVVLMETFHKSNKILQDNDLKKIDWEVISDARYKYFLTDIMVAADSGNSHAYDLIHMMIGYEGLEDNIHSRILSWANEAAVRNKDAKLFHKIGKYYYKNDDYLLASKYLKLAIDNGADAHYDLFDLLYLDMEMYQEAADAMSGAKELHEYMVRNLLDCYRNGAKANRKMLQLMELKRHDRDIYGVNKSVMNHTLGVMYYHGYGVDEDLDKARNYFHDLINMDMEFLWADKLDALRYLAHMYRYGQGTEKNIHLAIDYYYAIGNHHLQNKESREQKDKILDAYNNIEQLMPGHFLGKKLMLGLYAKDKSNDQSRRGASEKQYTLNATGFFVTDTQVMTNDHVVSSCSSITVESADYHSSATVKSYDKQNDLALLVTNKKAPAVAKFRSGRGIRTGSEIVTTGYPLGEVLGSGLKATTGNISSLSGVVGDITQMQITSPVQSGNSGGPVLDKSGNVVGVVRAKFGKRTEEMLDESLQNVNFAIKSTTAQAFLDANDIDYLTSRSDKNLDTADIVDQAKKYTVQVQCMN